MEKDDCDVISQLELESILSQLRTSPMEGVGNVEWSRHMSMLEQLNVQAALEAKRGGEERVRDALVEEQKMPLLVHELLLLEMWRIHVLPKILAIGTPQSTFQVYMVLFNEANLSNLLETTLFGASACEGLDDTAVDLVDYCVRNLTKLFSGELKVEPKSGGLLDGLSNWNPGDPLPTFPTESIEEELIRHDSEITFQIAMKSLSILRYLTDHLEQVSLGVTTRMTITHDVPILLTQLLESKPWAHVKKGRVMIFEGSDWIECSEDDDGQLPKLEAQAWIALYNLLSKRVCTDKYELNSYRLNVVTKLAAQINEDKENQLPILTKLREWLLRLSLTKPSAASASSKDLVLIETVSEIFTSLHNRYSTHFDVIAQAQSDTFLGETSAAWQAEAGRILETLDSEAAQSLLVVGDHPKSGCIKCQAPVAKSRCSRCRKVRYCSRECQAQHWPQHRQRCCPNSC